jgi:hypothetical protein
MDVSASPRAGSLSLLRQRVGAVPVLNRVLARLGLTEIVARYLPADDARLKIAPAVVVGVVVRNLLVGHRPAYAIGDWAAGFDPALFGLGPGQVRQLTDDRIARVLDRLFDADRASLLTDLIVRMVTEFDVDTGRCHNDSTSITFSGARPDRGGGQRGGTPVPLLHHGHNKDHRPALPQLVWILTVATDGVVPLAHRVANGNTTDDCTHIDTWNGLVKLLGRADFLYVADAKLATREQMDHIHRHGGRFITTLPRSRTEDRYFRREWLTANTPTWVEARRRPGPRLGDPDDVWSTFAFPQPSAEGHRIIWVLSSRRAHTDAADRTRRIQRACTALDELNERLSRPRSRTRTLLAADQAADAVLADAGGTAWITHYPEKINEFTYRQAGSGGGHPTPDTRYRRIERPYWTIRYQIDADAVARDALSDGCYPLITNTRNVTDAQILDNYKYQPHLERRYHVLKSHQLVAPMFLQRPHRIEALLCCHFIALLVGALIERQLRQAMANRQLPHLNIYPEARACTAPSTDRALELFAHLTRDTVHDQDGRPLQTFPPDLSPEQRQVLGLLGIPADTYTT